MSAAQTGELPDSAPVAIVGAGPAGLLLAHLLERQGVETVIVERSSREHVLGRVRAGVLEEPVVDLLTTLGLAERLLAERLVHGGIWLQHDGERHRVDFEALVGRSVTVYGQRELVTDLIELRETAGLPLHFETEVVDLTDLTGSPVLTVRRGGESSRIGARFVVGADGARSVTREAVPVAARRTVERHYDVSWLGVLAEAKPADPELIYAHHHDGFALASMRSASVSRLYLQVPASAALAEWSPERLWEHLHRRLDTAATVLNEGTILQTSLTPLRSVVHQTMRYGGLLLAGDAAHTVPPTGAKGLNLAVADVVVAARAITRALAGDPGGLETYAADCLPRIWQAVHFSWWMTTMLHILDDDPFHTELQRSQLAQVAAGGPLALHLADQYTGLPLTV